MGRILHDILLLIGTMTGPVFDISQFVLLNTGGCTRQV